MHETATLNRHTSANTPGAGGSAHRLTHALRDANRLVTSAVVKSCSPAIRLTGRANGRGIGTSAKNCRRRSGAAPAAGRGPQRYTRFVCVLSLHIPTLLPVRQLHDSTDGELSNVP